MIKLAQNEKVNRMNNPHKHGLEGWCYLPIQNIVKRDKNSIKIGPFGSSLKKEYLTKKGYKVYGQENVIFDDFKIGDRFINEERYRNLKSNEILPGDVVVSMMGTIGKTTVVPQGIQKGIMDSHLLRLRFNEELILKDFFIQQFNNYFPIKKQVMRMSVGGIMSGLSSSIIKKIVLVIPPIKEQQKIIDILSTWDKAIELKEKLIEQKKEQKKGLMQKLLTGEVRFPGFEADWKEVDKHEIKEKVIDTIDQKKVNLNYSKGKMVLRSIKNSYPIDWKPFNFDNLFKFEGGYSLSRDKLSNEGICYLHYGDIHKTSDSYIDIQRDYEQIPKYNGELKSINPKNLLEDGDIVFADASEDYEGIGKAVVVFNKDNLPFINGLHTIVAKDKTDLIYRDFKRYFLSDWNIRRQMMIYATGISVLGISKTNLKKIKVTLPSKIEQKKIADVLSTLDKEIDLLTQELNALKQQKRGLIQQLLTGKVRVRV